MLRWRATADSDDEYEQAIDRKEIVNADDDDNDDADDTDDEDCDEDGDFIGNHATLRHNDLVLGHVVDVVLLAHCSLCLCLCAQLNSFRVVVCVSVL